MGVFGRGEKSDAEQVKERRRRIRRNSLEIQKYLDSFERIHRSSAASTVPAGAESKGMRQYVAPISEAGFFWLDDAGNKQAATLLSPIFAKMRREQYPFYYACGLVAGWYSPQAQRPQAQQEEPEKIKRWECEKEQKGDSLEVKREKRLRFEARKERVMRQRAAEAIRQKRNEQYLGLGTGPTSGPPSNEEPDHGILKRWQAEDPEALAVFRAACEWAAEQLPENVELDVSVEGGRQAANLRQAAAQDREARRKEQYARSYRIRYAKLKETEAQHPDATREAAKAMCSERLGTSMSSMRDSVRFCERHVWPNGEPVEPPLRWQDEGAADKAS